MKMSLCNITTWANGHEDNCINLSKKKKKKIKPFNVERVRVKLRNRKSFLFGDQIETQKMSVKT